MTIYWIDSGVLISAKNGLYAQELVPKFWIFLESRLKDGSIRMPKMCFDEITDGNDELARWSKQRKSIGYFSVRANKEVQQQYQVVADHISSNPKHKPHQIADFLRGADGWVIAHALATNGFVVTEELRNDYKGKIKIPIVAKTLPVRVTWKATHEMCKELKAEF